MATYTGYTTINGRIQKLTDFELVKQDITNAFYIKTGEKLMQPTLGCDAPYLVFDKNDPTTLSKLETSIKQIISNEPRVSLNSLNLSSSNNTIYANISLVYNDTGNVSSLNLTLSQ